MLPPVYQSAWRRRSGDSNIRSHCTEKFVSYPMAFGLKYRFKMAGI
jgi:hypothetical protein